MLLLCQRGRECCAGALGWREGCESVLNMGALCNISTVALPAFIHPPFPSTIPLSFLCLRLYLFILMAFAGAHLALTLSQPGGHWDLTMCPWDRGLALGWLRGLGVPVPWCRHTGLGSSRRTGHRTRGAMAQGWQPGVCPTPSMAWGSCPASEQCLFSRLKGSL